MKSQKEIVLSMIKKQVKEIDPSADIILYGSRARGDERPDSDWDILILVNTKADIETEKVFRHKLFGYGSNLLTLLINPCQGNQRI